MSLESFDEFFMLLFVYVVTIFPVTIVLALAGKLNYRRALGWPFYVPGVLVWLLIVAGRKIGPAVEDAFAFADRMASSIREDYEELWK